MMTEGEIVLDPPGITIAVEDDVCRLTDWLLR